MQDDGFDMVAWLHEHGIAVTAWTPDYRGPESLRSLDRLIAAGIDRITTNTIPQWVASSITM
jgi:glycerophosphoryl diester phosphodiesterase